MRLLLTIVLLLPSVAQAECFEWDEHMEAVTSGLIADVNEGRAQGDDEGLAEANKSLTELLLIKHREAQLQCNPESIQPLHVKVDDKVKTIIKITEDEYVPMDVRCSISQHVIDDMGTKCEDDDCLSLFSIVIALRDFYKENC